MICYNEFCFVCPCLFRDLRDIGAKKIAVHSLNKVVHTLKSSHSHVYVIIVSLW